MSLSSPLLPELTPDEQALLEKGKTELQNAQLTDEQKEWILHMLKGGVKISTSQVLRIWKIVDQRKKALGVDLQSECLWVEEGQEHDPAKRPSGYRHMLKHEHEFPDHIRGLDLLELAEAATQVGTRAGNQGAKKNRAGRPILLLIYKGTPLAVALSVGMNGYVVGMNRQSWEKNIGSLHQLEVGRWPDFPKVNTEEYWKVIGVEYAYVHGDGVVFQQHSEPIGVEYAYVRGGVVVFQQNNEPVDAWVYNELGWADYGDGYEHKWKWYGAFGAYVP